MLSRLPSLPGTYLLHLYCTTATHLEAGGLGSLRLSPGVYLYLGSAHGPGGLRARLGHHLRPVKRPHWHLDYLRRYCTLGRIWYSTAPGADECLWATAAEQIRGGRAPFAGFGASDCRCPTHLFWFTRSPALATFRQKLRLLTGHHEVIRTLTTDPT